MAYSVVHEIKGRLRAGCAPVFSTDGLWHYYYALTAHFGKWEGEEGKKPLWARYESELMKHLAWWRSYYHFVRYHESLEEILATSIERKGKQRSQRIRRQTPATLALR